MVTRFPTQTRVRVDSSSEMKTVVLIYGDGRRTGRTESGRKNVTPGGDEFTNRILRGITEKRMFCKTATTGTLAGIRRRTGTDRVEGPRPEGET